MGDETVPAGEQVLTTGGDHIYPKGLLVGRVTKVAPGSDLFLNIRVRPAADLSRLEEVLVVTKIDESQTEPDQTGAARAVDILAERLPGVPAKPENAEQSGAPGAACPGTAAATSPGSDAKPKDAPPAASASSGEPAARKTVNSASFLLSPRQLQGLGRRQTETPLQRFPPRPRRRRPNPTATRRRG